VTTVADRGVPDPGLGATRCAICGFADEADEVYAPSLSPDAFTPATFSARRPPDRVHYRMVRCRRCGLVRSDPTASAEVMADLYRGSTFDYGEELQGLRATYGKALDRVAARVPSRHGLLDIGCGNGFVLGLALDRGWDGVRGVEPSADAIARAPSALASMIVHDIMRPGLFASESFDAVTLFQVLDHMPDPLTLLRECRKILRPGGVVLALNHNVSAWSARLLGERSPIVDVEHTYLYSPETMRKLFEQAGFAEITVGAVCNTYSLAYLVHLLPFPERLKASVVPRLRHTRAGRFQLTVPLGNLCLVAHRQE
jgi:SAM-dependent methyltransferase